MHAQSFENESLPLESILAFEAIVISVKIYRVFLLLFYHFQNIYQNTQVISLNNSQASCFVLIVAIILKLCLSDPQ